MDVLVLSTGFEPMYLIGWTQAIGDIFRGRVEIVQESKTRVIGTVGGTIPMPSVVRFKEGVFLNCWSKRKKLVKLTRRNLWLRDSGACQYCNNTVGIKTYEIEHVIPKSQGGETNWRNVVVACTKCNQKKGPRTPAEAGMKLAKLPKPPDINRLMSPEMVKFRKTTGY